MSDDEKPNYIYIHVCCINNWKDIFNRMIFHIKNSGLYNKVKRIRCNILTENEDDLFFFDDEKIEIIGTSTELNLYEVSTINLLYKDSFSEDFNVLYLHTKGVKHNDTNINIIDWVKFMTYFNIYHHDTCIINLLNFDTIGVNLITNPEVHYSGNFWWSKSEYIRKLQNCNYITYCSPEFWITEKKCGKYLCLWNSPEHIYMHMHRYEEDNYVNKGFSCKVYDF